MMQSGAETDSAVVGGRVGGGAGGGRRGGWGVGRLEWKRSGVNIPLSPSGSNIFLTQSLTVGF